MPTASSSAIPRSCRRTGEVPRRLSLRVTISPEARRDLRKPISVLRHGDIHMTESPRNVMSGRCAGTSSDGKGVANSTSTVRLAGGPITYEKSLTNPVGICNLSVEKQEGVSLSMPSSPGVPTSSLSVGASGFFYGPSGWVVNRTSVSRLSNVSKRFQVSILIQRPES